MGQDKNVKIIVWGMKGLAALGMATVVGLLMYNVATA